MTTRSFGTAGPYGHVPGAAPPYHSAQVDPADQARPDMSRVSGTDVDPLANAPGPVGLRSWDGGNLGYAGRDITDPATHGNRPYNESPGMFHRLAEEHP